MRNYYNFKNIHAKCLLTFFGLVMGLGINAQSAEFTGFALTYFQNFDGLSTEYDNPGNLEWTNGSTPLVGWYGYRNMEDTPNTPSTVYGTGCDNDGSGALAFPAGNNLNSLGFDPAGDTSSTAVDRALGWRVSNSGGEPAIMLNISNNIGGGFEIPAIRVKYTGEQWASVGGNDQTLLFSYKLNATAPDDATGWTEVPQLTFTGPKNSGTDGSTSTVRIDGNLAENKVVGIEHSFNIAIPEGATITLRWYKPDLGQSDHILALDDLEVQALMQPVVLSTSKIEKDDVLFKIDSGQLKVSSQIEFNKVSIYAMTGALVKEVTLNNSRETSISVENLHSGLYIAKVQTQEGSAITKKFIK